MIKMKQTLFFFIIFGAAVFIIDSTAVAFTFKDLVDETVSAVTNGGSGDTGKNNESIAVSKQSDDQKEIERKSGAIHTEDRYFEQLRTEAYKLAKKGELPDPYSMRNLTLSGGPEGGRVGARIKALEDGYGVYSLFSIRSGYPNLNHSLDDVEWAYDRYSFVKYILSDKAFANKFESERDDILYKINGYENLDIEKANRTVEIAIHNFNNFNATTAKPDKMMSFFRSYIEKYKNFSDQLYSELAKELKIIYAQKEKEEQLAAIEEENKSKQVKQSQLQAKQKSVPKLIVTKFKDCKKPDNYEDIKNLITFFPKWKVTVGDINITQNFIDKWDVIEDYFRDENNPFNFNKKDNEIIFERIPINAKSYKNRPLFIGPVQIEKEIEDYYVITDSEGKEAFALSQSIIQDSGLSYNEPCYMVGNYVGSTTAQTLVGGIKQVAMFSVKGVIRIEDYDAFCRYVVGHPSEFPQEKYVKIKFFPER